MALKIGTENKRNVAIAVVLFLILGFMAIRQFSGPSTPVPVAAPAPVRPEAMHPAPGAPANRTFATGSSGARIADGPEAYKLPGSGLDPALHLEKLATSESIEYAGSGRNIFSGDSTPVAIETALVSARPKGPLAPPVWVPPPVPTAPAIDLRYFGYSAAKDGRREAFFLHGDDIFEAAAGDIVNHRYKVVSVEPHSVQVTDLSYNNTQTLQLLAN
jgi:hypothetical protein